mgnify:FL=1|tara:strand:+ start:12954 stop:14195 length:1242 start_codon:yes stop_codon:yes gene_type:complete
MVDIINEGDSKIEVIDSGAAAAAEITAVLNNVERADITSTLISFYNPSDQIETGNATDNNSGAASTFNGLQVNDATIRVQSGDGSSIPQSNLYIDGKSIISDKTLAIGTTGQKELHLGTNSTSRFKITESGYVDFTKMEINGQQGTAGQYIRNAGNGNIEWATLANNNAFGTVKVGATNLNAASVGDIFTIAAGSNVTLTPDNSNNTLTIGATQPNVFQNVAVSGQSTIAADATSDTFTVAAGSGIQITTDASTDTLTITNTLSVPAAADAVFKTLAVTGQANVIASSATDTLNLAAGDGMEITTNDGSSEISFRNEALERLSKEGFLVFTKADGTADKMPLRNFFINQTTSEAVNGGGSNVGQSTRALRMLKSDGSTFKFMIMPANSNGESLVFTFTKQDGSTVTKDITMAA